MPMEQLKLLIFHVARDRNLWAEVLQVCLGHHQRVQDVLVRHSQLRQKQLSYSGRNIWPLLSDTAEGSVCIFKFLIADIIVF